MRRPSTIRGSVAGLLGRSAPATFCNTADYSAPAGADLSLTIKQDVCLGLPGKQVVEYRLHYTRTAVRCCTSVSVDSDSVTAPADYAVHGATALAPGGVYGVVDFSGVHRSYLPRVVPLRPAWLVAWVARDICRRREQIAVRINAEAEPTRVVPQLGREPDCAVVLVLVS